MFVVKEYDPNMMYKFSAVLAVGLVLMGCQDPNDKSVVEDTSNPVYSVRKLFTNDGCTAYRFKDDGRYRYYVVCDKDQQVTTSNSYTTLVGKVTHYHDDEISTVVK